MKNKYIRWAIVVILLVLILRFLGMPPFDQSSSTASPTQGGAEISYSDIYTNITNGKVKELE